MRGLDLSPLFRHSVGFDRMSEILETMARENSGQSGYPPYNIERLADNYYQISMAVAGFSEDDIEVTLQDNFLIIRGLKNIDETVESERIFLHRGIAQRSFERRFQIAEHIEVEEAIMEHGLLHINLKRHVPEEEKPKKIPINKTHKKQPKILKGD